MIATVAASLPFLIAGQVGILGAGLINDDMASHLLIADYVRDPAGFVPELHQGRLPDRPPRGRRRALGGPRADLVEAFAGFTLALAPLTGLLALGLLGELLARRAGSLGAALVALAYLGASYLPRAPSRSRCRR